jgi:hypothetical protein
MERRFQLAGRPTANLMGNAVGERSTGSSCPSTTHIAGERSAAANQSTLSICTADTGSPMSFGSMVAPRLAIVHCCWPTFTVSSCCCEWAARKTPLNTVAPASAIDRR